jgi:hypothetical protein
MARKRKLSKAEQLTRSIARWEGKQEAAVIMLRKSAEQLLKLRRQQRRMLKTGQTPDMAKPAEPLAMTDAQWKETLASVKPLSPELRAEALATADCDDGVPQFLQDAAAKRNRKLQTLPDPKTKEKKAERKVIEKEVRQAELTGKRRKMPLAGKEALAKIAE